MSAATSPPLVTVVTCTRNAERTIDALAASLRAQTHHRFDWVVQDGCSGDRTLDRIAASGVPARVESRADSGVYDAMNRAVSRVRTPFYVVAGADDLFDPDAMAIFTRHADAPGAADVMHFEVDGLPAPRWWARLAAAPRPPAHSVGTLIRTALHERLGPYPSGYLIAADTCFLARATRHARVEHVARQVGRFASGGLSTRRTPRLYLEHALAAYEAGASPLRTTLYLATRLPRVLGAARRAGR